MKKPLSIVLIVMLIIAVYLARNTAEPALPTTAQPEQTLSSIDENGVYTSKEQVALYLFTYGKLPRNFITKDKARDLGWQADKQNLWEVTEEMSIGGDRFYNREGLLPEANKRQWFECDIDYKGGSRGAKRIVYSSDGLVYYTDDHYESFTELKESDLP